MSNSTGLDEEESEELVRIEEVVIVMLVMVIWLYSCVLFYIRYSRFIVRCSIPTPSPTSSQLSPL